MAALMKQRVIHVFTHDSIGLGEDGPTHQSVEHVPSLRIIPGLDVWRPADGLETAVAWAVSLERRDGPSALCLSRQNLPRLSHIDQASSIRQGGYILRDVANPQAVIVATGSELEIACQAQERLIAKGLRVRVVSMPSTNVFDRQSQAYQDEVLPLSLPAVAVEAAHPDGWRKYVGRTGRVVGIASFGESAPAKDLYAYFGITADAVAQAVEAVVAA
jgi:transketolase